jgi:hypothetical protein
MMEWLTGLLGNPMTKGLATGMNAGPAASFGGFGGLPAQDMTSVFGQGNLYGPMPNLMEHSSVPMQPGLGIDNSMAQPGAFPTLQGIPDVVNPVFDPANLGKMASLAGMAFNRQQPRQQMPAGGIHRMNQMQPYQFGMARMAKR